MDDDVTLHRLEIPVRLEYGQDPVPASTADFLAAAQLGEMLQARFWGHNDFYRSPEQRLRDAQPSAERVEETVLARTPELEDDDPRGGVVGLGRLVRCPGDGDATAWLWVGVDPRFRRRGIGRRLHEALVEAARGPGCSVLQAWTDHRRLAEDAGVGESATVLDEAGAEACFARACGYAPAEREFVQVLHLERLRRDAVQGDGEAPQGAQGSAEVVALGATLPSGHRLVAWEAPCPAEHVEAMARLRGLMDSDAPSGELDEEHAPWDARRYRAQEARRRAAGESVFTVAALDGDGRVVGHSDLEAYAARPHVAFQGATIVDRAHRGHGLGRRMKEANLARFAQVWPEAERLYTWNSTSNAPMLRVNQALGYVPAALSVGWQRSLEG